MTDPMHVFDRRAVRRHRDRAAGTVDAVADLLEDAASRLLDRLDDITTPFTRALDVGGRGIVAKLLRARGIETVACDLSPAMAARSARSRLPPTRRRCRSPMPASTSSSPACRCIG